MNRFVFGTALGLCIVYGTQALTYGLTMLFGDHCWGPRIGGVLVGLAVFLQGLVYAHGDDMQRLLRSGITLEQRLLHVVYVSSVWGTFVWAFGDFVTVLWGLEVCRK